MSERIETFEDMLQYLTSQSYRITESFASEQAKVFRNIAAVAYNFGQLDALRGIIVTRKVEGNERHDIEDMIKRLWKEDDENET